MSFQKEWSGIERVTLSSGQSLSGLRECLSRYGDYALQISSCDGSDPPLLYHGYHWEIVLHRSGDGDVDLSISCHPEYEEALVPYFEVVGKFTVSWGPKKRSWDDKATSLDDGQLIFGHRCEDFVTVSDLVANEDEFWLDSHQEYAAGVVDSSQSSPSTTTTRSSSSSSSSQVIDSKKEKKKKKIIIQVEIQLLHTNWFPSYYNSISENRNWSRMLSNGEFSDITFVLGGNDGDADDRDKSNNEEHHYKKRKTTNEVEIRAHRTLLSARVPAMLEILYPDEERRTETRIAIPSIKEHVFRLMLNFIHTGKFENIVGATEEPKASVDPLDDDQTMVELLTAANRFGCVDLKLRLETSTDNYM